MVHIHIDKFIFPKNDDSYSTIIKVRDEKSLLKSPWTKKKASESPSGLRHHAPKSSPPLAHASEWAHGVSESLVTATAKHIRLWRSLCYVRTILYNLLMRYVKYYYKRCNSVRVHSLNLTNVSPNMCAHTITYIYTHMLWFAECLALCCVGVNGQNHILTKWHKYGQWSCWFTLRGSNSNSASAMFKINIFFNKTAESPMSHHSNGQDDQHENPHGQDLGVRKLNKVAAAPRCPSVFWSSCKDGNFLVHQRNDHHQANGKQNRTLAHKHFPEGKGKLILGIVTIVILYSDELDKYDLFTHRFQKKKVVHHSSIVLPSSFELPYMCNFVHLDCLDFGISESVYLHVHMRCQYTHLCELLPSHP